MAAIIAQMAAASRERKRRARIRGGLGLPTNKSNVVLMPFPRSNNEQVGKDIFFKLKLYSCIPYAVKSLNINEITFSCRNLAVLMPSATIVGPSKLGREQKEEEH